MGHGWEAKGSRQVREQVHPAPGRETAAAALRIPTGTAPPALARRVVEHQDPKKAGLRAFSCKRHVMRDPTVAWQDTKKSLCFKRCWSGRIAACKGWGRRFTPTVGAGSWRRLRSLCSEGITKNRVRSTPQISGNYSKRKM